MARMKSNEVLLEEFLNDVRLRGWSKWSIRSAIYSIRLLFSTINKNCTRIGMDDLKKHLSVLKQRPGHRGNEIANNETIRKHINNLASFFEYLELEDYIDRSPMRQFRKRYLRLSQRGNGNGSRRQIISIEEMSRLITTTLDPQERAIMCVLAKTGVRVMELVSMDISDIDWTNYSIKLKSTGKRKQQPVFFDNECAKCLRQWLSIRNEVAIDPDALFITISNGKRAHYVMINYMIKKKAESLKIHDEKSPDLEKRFTAHCFRHWFTTHLRRAGMPREYIKELRGDSRGETMDIYDHIDEEELRRSYLTYIPQLGI